MKSKLNTPKAQELYKRFAEYQDKKWWEEVKTGQSGNSDIDTKQWKANSGENAFYLSPADYNRYNEIYKKEQEEKKKAAEAEAKKEKETKTATTKARTRSSTYAPKTTTTTPPAAFTYKPTAPVSFFNSAMPPAAPPPPSPLPAAPQSPAAPSVVSSPQNPSGATTSLGAANLAPLMSQTADTTTRINNILAQLTGLLSGGGLYGR